MERHEKARQLQRGLSPRALRSLYTGAIRLVFCYGAELWNGIHCKTKISSMERLEYQALRKITSRYHRSSMEKLGYIAGVEPLQAKLDDISTSWAARSLRTGDARIRAAVATPVSPSCTAWFDGTTQLLTDSPIASAFYISAIPSPVVRP